MPDHGDAWSRPWRPAAGGAFQVDCDDFSLVRLITHQNGEVVVDYRMRAAAGYRFIWAAHALLDLTEGAELHAASGTPTRLFAEAEPYVDDWPTGAHSLWGSWPAPAGLRLDRCGRQDGTAVGAVLCPHETGEAEIEVGDGSDVLRLHLDAPGQPASMALWRNLGGFPATKPYRSIGVEPMLGRVFDLADAGEGEAAVVPAGGELRWRLTVTASRTASGEGSCL
ncbi:hypothetical protein [Streptomyces tauricus]|uniref:hypothetical protein n=1 Tax=Streptomyces tauricus TaxID=68274 RepID=UPI003435309C